MSAGTLLLALLAIGVAALLGGLGQALFGRRSTTSTDAGLTGWCWCDPQVRGAAVFLAGSVLAIGSLVVFLAIA